MFPWKIDTRNIKTLTERTHRPLCRAFGLLSTGMPQSAMYIAILGLGTLTDKLHRPACVGQATRRSDPLYPIRVPASDPVFGCRGYTETKTSPGCRPENGKWRPGGDRVSHLTGPHASPHSVCLCRVSLPGSSFPSYISRRL